VLQASCWSRGVVTILLADMSPIAASAVARCSVGGDADQAVERVDDIGRHDDGVSEHRLQHREGVKQGRVADAAARELRPQPRRRGVASSPSVRPSMRGRGCFSQTRRPAHDHVHLRLTPALRTTIHRRRSDVRLREVGAVGDHGPRRPGGGLHLIVARRRSITTPTCSDLSLSEKVA
jgi:hypothetical protein